MCGMAVQDGGQGLKTSGGLDDSSNDHVGINSIDVLYCELCSDTLPTKTHNPINLSPNGVVTARIPVGFGG